MHLYPNLMRKMWRYGRDGFNQKMGVFLVFHAGMKMASIAEKKLDRILECNSHYADDGTGDLRNVTAHVYTYRSGFKNLTAHIYMFTYTGTGFRNVTVH